MPFRLNFPVTAGIRYANGAQKCVSRRKDWPPWHSGSALPWYGRGRQFDSDRGLEGRVYARF